MARYRKKDWISLLKKNRNLETNSFILKDAAGQAIRLEGPHIAVEDLVPLIPPTAYREVTVGISLKNWGPWRAPGKKTGSVC